MKLLIKSFLFLAVVVLTASCTSNKHIAGRYRSNFARYGFFVTDIKFNRDSTVEYHMAGDVISENLTGRFKIVDNIVYFKIDKLKYIEVKDTLSLEELMLLPIDTTENKNYHHYDLKVENDISYHLKFKIKSNKLLVYDNKTNKIIRKAEGSKKKAKYYLKKLETY